MKTATIIKRRMEDERVTPAVQLDGEAEEAHHTRESKRNRKRPPHDGRGVPENDEVRIMEIVGVLLMMLGGSAMDSESRLIPAVMFLAGLALMARKGVKGWK